MTHAVDLDAFLAAADVAETLPSGPEGNALMSLKADAPYCTEDEPCSRGCAVERISASPSEDHWEKLRVAWQEVMRWTPAQPELRFGPAREN